MGGNEHTMDGRSCDKDEKVNEPASDKCLTPREWRFDADHEEGIELKDSAFLGLDGDKFKQHKKPPPY